MLSSINLTLQRWKWWDIKINPFIPSTHVLHDVSTDTWKTRHRAYNDTVWERNFMRREWFQFSHCELWTFHLYDSLLVVLQDFLDRGLLLARKLQNQGFVVEKLKSSLAIMTCSTVVKHLDHRWPWECSVWPSQKPFF